MIHTAATSEAHIVHY